MSQQVAEYVDHMGTDKSVVNAARLSFGVGHETSGELTKKDIGLIHFLAFGLRSDERQSILAEIRDGVKNVYSEEFDGQSDEYALELYNQIRHQAVHWTPFAHTAIYPPTCSAYPSQHPSHIPQPCTKVSWKYHKKSP